MEIAWLLETTQETRRRVFPLRLDGPRRWGGGFTRGRVLPKAVGSCFCVSRKQQVCFLRKSHWGPGRRAGGERQGTAAAGKVSEPRQKPPMGSISRRAEGQPGVPRSREDGEELALARQHLIGDSIWARGGGAGADMGRLFWSIWPCYLVA